MVSISIATLVAIFALLLTIITWLLRLSRELGEIASFMKSYAEERKEIWEHLREHDRWILERIKNKDRS